MLGDYNIKELIGLKGGYFHIHLSPNRHRDRLYDTPETSVCLFEWDSPPDHSKENSEIFQENCITGLWVNPAPSIARIKKFLVGVDFNPVHDVGSMTFQDVAEFLEYLGGCTRF